MCISHVNTSSFVVSFVKKGSRTGVGWASSSWMIYVKPDSAHLLFSHTYPYIFLSLCQHVSSGCMSNTRCDHLSLLTAYPKPAITQTPILWLDRKDSISSGWCFSFPQKMTFIYSSFCLGSEQARHSWRWIWRALIFRVMELRIS